MAFGEIKRKPGRPTTGAASDSDRQHKHISEHSRVDRNPCEDPRRRKRLEANPAKWLRWYFPNAYYRKFEKPHLEIIDGAINAHETDGRFGVSAERGIGKSALLWGLVLFLKFTGRRRFPICVPWKKKDMKRAFRFWKMALCFNDRLAADYPEYCAPFRHAKGIAQRVLTTTWRDTGDLTGAQLTIGEGMMIFPDNLGCIGGDTINGNVRGVNHTMEDGTILRPDIAMLDDIQDRKTARSIVLCDGVIEIIDGDVAGCGEAGTEMPMLMSGNCIEPEDVMAHYLTSSEWKGLRVPCVLNFPDGWNDDESSCRILWREWQDIFSMDEKSTNPVKFYKKHKAVMIKGMVLSAPSTFHKSKLVPDAMYGAIRSYHAMGHSAFMAEKQQNPERKAYSIYVLTRELIQSRADQSMGVGFVPDWAQTVLCATDINPSYALTSVVAGFARDQRSAVLWYGKHNLKPYQITNDMTDSLKKKLIYEALSVHGKELAGLPCRPNMWVIDGGGSPARTVIDFCANSPRICGLESVTAFGRGWRNYRPTARHKVAVGEECHRVIESRDSQWIIWQADYWREMAQKGWTGAPGSPGSCSLPKGQHADFCTQIYREQLVGKDVVGGKTVWVYNTAPGEHDYGDDMAMLYMLASLMGIGTGGQQIQQAPPMRGRRVTHVSV